MVILRIVRRKSLCCLHSKHFDADSGGKVSRLVNACGAALRLSMLCALVAAAGCMGIGSHGVVAVA